jgi:hypothetical protein
MTIQLSEDQTKILAERVWKTWDSNGLKSRYMEYLDVYNLAKYFLKICREQKRDSREFDFPNLIDITLRFEENRAMIENELGGLNSEIEKEASNKLKDYLTEEKLQEYSVKDKSVIEELQTSNQNLNKKINQVVKQYKAHETQTLDAEELRKEIEKYNENLTLMNARLEQIPNLAQLVAALKASENFKPVGKAIEPILKTIPEPTPQPKKEVKKQSFWHPKQQIALLDLFAALCVTLMFVGFSYGLVNWIGLTWGLIVWLPILWISYVVVVRLVVGGILN